MKEIKGIISQRENIWGRVSFNLMKSEPLVWVMQDVDYFEPFSDGFGIMRDTHYTAVPREMLQRLGVPVERSLHSETADGRILPVDVGRTTIRLEELEFSTPVIFAEEGEPSLLGVVSLEEAALAVDPLAGRLIPANLLRF